MSSISFSDQFMLLGLRGSQYLIGRSSLDVDVNNTKPCDLFSALYTPCIKADKAPCIFLMLSYNTSFEAKVLSSHENLRIPKQLTLLCLFWYETWLIPLLIPRLVSAPTRGWKPVSMKKLTPVCILFKEINVVFAFPLLFMCMWVRECTFSIQQNCIMHNYSVSFGH